MIKITNWEQSKDLIKPIRYQVFVVEQGIPEAEEWDDDDAMAIHAMAISNQEVIGTGRLIMIGTVAKIGRLSILKSRRAEGFGKAILRQLIETGKEKGVQEFILHAQVHAIDFYLRELTLQVSELYSSTHKGGSLGNHPRRANFLVRRERKLIFRPCSRAPIINLILQRILKYLSAILVR